LLAVTFTVAIPAVAHADDDSSRRVTVMTRNLYVGSSFSHILEATDPVGFIQGATTFWANVQATNFPARAEALADEIAAERPDLVGLQEVSLFRTQVPRDATTPATEVAQDRLQILLDALAARGLAYEVAASVTDFDAEAPVFGGPTGLIDVRLTDRDVVLVGADVPGLRVTGSQSGNYDARVVVASPVGPIPTPRGWNAVDARLGGERFRLVNTHLEPADQPLVQEAQARELVAGPLAGGRTTIALGDFNSAAGGSTTASYGILRAAGFDDAWSELTRRRPGFTCCQAELLDNPLSQLHERVDLVLLGEGAKAKEARLVGEDPADRIAGLWPSDHAGVVATVRLRDR
jgi:endonuclease/exonuclease/phosphatase family metal-dependent hydrolase